MTDRTERKPTAYERICADACEWCAQGIPLYVGKGIHHAGHGLADPRCTAPSRDAVIVSRNIELADLTAELARVTKERERLFDLVRYSRHALHTDGLISDEEYSDILAGGSASNADGGSVKRLGGYDEIRAAYTAELAALKQERDELRDASAKDERAHLSTIDERDAAEDWFGKLAALFGVETEFSNLRGYADIYNDCAARTAQQEGKPVESRIQGVKHGRE